MSLVITGLVFMSMNLTIRPAKDEENQIMLIHIIQLVMMVIVCFVSVKLSPKVLPVIFMLFHIFIFVIAPLWMIILLLSRIEVLEQSLLYPILWASAIR